MARKVHLIAYDIRDDRRLRLVAKALEGYGERIQFSVFRCRLTPRTRAKLLWELAKVMAPEDSLLVIPLCDNCNRGVDERGQVQTWPKEDPGHVVY